jgi:hypothetical protein
VATDSALVLASSPAFGGGIVRDLILGATPVAAFTRWEFLAVPLAAAGVTFFVHPELERLIVQSHIGARPWSSALRVPGTQTRPSPAASKRRRVRELGAFRTVP